MHKPVLLLRGGRMVWIESEHMVVCMAMYKTTVYLPADIRGELAGATRRTGVSQAELIPAGRAASHLCVKSTGIRAHHPQNAPSAG